MSRRRGTSSAGWSLWTEEPVFWAERRPHLSLRRILILGGTGRLGRHVLKASGDAMHTAVQAPTRAELDLGSVSQSELDERVGSGLFDVVLNCAAAANVDACEEDPRTAVRLNTTVPGMLATAAQRAEIPFVHISTDYVFGGEGAEQGLFAESTPTAPAQRYGQTKADGEQAVFQCGGRRTVARVSWLFGPGAKPFEDYVLGKARAEGVVPVLDQSSRPTWLPGLARWLVTLCTVMVDGAFVPAVLHPAGGPTASRATWARAILDAHGLTDVATTNQAIGGALKAARPRDSRLSSERTDEWTRATWSAGLPDWREKIRSD